VGKATIYGKKIWEVLETIYDVEEHYCINGMFYIKTKEQEYYFSLDLIGAIYIDSESEC
jgi:hypothetical protein